MFIEWPRVYIFVLKATFLTACVSTTACMITLIACGGV